MIGPLCENMNLNPSMEIKPGIAYARIGNARQSLEPRTLRLFSSSASASPPKKLIEVDSTAQRMFQVRMRPNVSPMEPTPRIFVQAESDQLASRGCTMSPPKSVNAIRIMNTMGRIVKMLTPITGSTRAVTWNLSSAMVASDWRNVCGRLPRGDLSGGVEHVAHVGDVQNEEEDQDEDGEQPEDQHLHGVVAHDTEPEVFLLRAERKEPRDIPKAPGDKIPQQP